jgi:hypothetical protein
MTLKVFEIVETCTVYLLVSLLLDDFKSQNILIKIILNNSS